MTREVSLVPYLPPFIAEYKEISTALEAENPEFGMVWKTADSVLRNAFIATADEYGISRFEKLLGILPSAGDTLEDRRARVQAVWFISLPYTWRMLVQKMDGIFGTAYGMVLEQKGAYTIRLTAKLELQWQADELIWVMERMLPCNMGVFVKTVLPMDAKTPAPVLKSDWIVYAIEYRGAVIHSRECIRLKAVCTYMRLPFWGSLMYTGNIKYDGTSKYNAQRNYWMRIGTRHMLGWHVEQAVRLVQTAAWLHTRSTQDASLRAMSCGYGVRHDGQINTAVQLHTECKTPCSTVGNISVETRRNVVLYGEVHQYDGTMKYNALHRKEHIE
ncbi:MAG: YmfQ family protein [Lachnospiraceae bacterium]|nr:YmfQ family protein [Lachnospiraceae bacterium]